MTDLLAVRDEVIAYTRRQLVGPFGDADEVIVDPPNRRYLMGILFPRKMEAETFFEEEGEALEVTDAKTDAEEALFADGAVASSNDFLPSSLGISFFTDAPAINVDVEGARYETVTGKAAASLQIDPTEDVAEDDVQDQLGGRRRRRRVWRRRPLAMDPLPFDAGGKATIWDGRAQVRVTWRPLAPGVLVTVTLVNLQEVDTPEQVALSWDAMLLQCAVSITLPEGHGLLEYPALGLASEDAEEEELRLQYRDRKTYAVGHGCAPVWGASLGWTRTEVMPRVEVPRIAAAGAGGSVLDVHGLSDLGANDATVVADLYSFVREYETWALAQRRASATLDLRHRDAAGRVVQRVERAASRMRQGVEQLENDATALRAFRLANRAMLMQMAHAHRELAGTRRAVEDDVALPSAYAAGPTWRPFQLGFFLSAVAGLCDPSHPDRDVLDLIWFPTGGGKTEAYLLLATFEIFHRRFEHGEVGAGTTVLSRYTLSLLTAQQFQRAATTLCAAEVIKRELSPELGESPISIGLWVGDATTPNRYEKACEVFDELRDAEEPSDKFLLERCPWCGTEIMPRRRSEDEGRYGIRATTSSFEFFCPRSECPFHDRLWVHVVDDDVYAHPPTFLLGTVDKFASLAWEPRSGVLFGSAGHRAPSLIIQDELHLLTGPLGTIVGLYERAIELLCVEDGHPPKRIASTATIRRAADQVSGLAGRPVELFPPSGLDADKSYFAEVDVEEPNRLYVGVMAQGHTADTATVQTCTALLQAPVDLGLHGASQDAYWTLVAYHNSLRELGRTVTMALDDIPLRIRSLISGRPKRDFDVEELTSNVARDEQPRLLERLGLPAHVTAHIGMLATTNMLSVGVDVPRLGLMLVNGQPKATAEYIQATSRVGRGTTPGLIVSLLRSTRPRDRSHYESFGTYHSALYRYVEPTSVTPFAPPARERALHAALVILVRHSLGMSGDDRAGEILTRESEVRQIADTLVAAVERTEPRETAGARKELDAFISSWVDDASIAADEGRFMYYKSNGRGHTNLLKDFGAKGQGRRTLRSMRNVDRASAIGVTKSATTKEKR